MAGSDKQLADHEGPPHVHSEIPTSLRPRSKYFNRLPVPVPSLIGRNKEFQALCQLVLRPEIRLVTMTGTGGIGKTCLALACAREMQPFFVNGASFVSLAAVHHPDFVLSELLHMLDITEHSHLSALASLKHALRESHLLLVLDNVEHLLDAAPLLLDVLQDCAQITLLVTSRETLYLPGEHVFPVPPLALPDPRQTDVSVLATNPSLMLFVKRAQERQPEFQLTSHNASALLQICRRMDGLPLALELAAARMLVLTPQQLLSRLTHSLDLLSRPGHAVPERQQTMRNTIRWSYDLLGPREQELFCRLSVFVGDYSLSTIEAWSKYLGDDPDRVLESIASLFDKNMLVQSQPDESEPCFGQLETIREFAQEMLETLGQREHIRAAHAAYYASLVPQPAPTQLALAEGAWLDFLKRAYPNLLAALHFFEEIGDLTQTLHLVIGIGGIWSVNGYISEGNAELERALALCHQTPGVVSPSLLATASTLAGRIASYQTDLLRTRYWYRKALETGETLRTNPFLILATAGFALVESELGNYAAYDALYHEWLPKLRQQGSKMLPRLLSVSPLIWLRRGMLEQARADAEESLQLLRVLDGQQWALAVVLHASGWISYVQERWASAHASGQKSVALFRQLGMPSFALEALCTFASETAALGDDETARALFEEALTLSQQGEDRRESSRALCGLGYLALRGEHLAQARLLFEESLTTLEFVQQLSTRFTHLLASSLEGLAFIACAEHHWKRTACFLGAADTLRHQDQNLDPLGKDPLFWQCARAASAQALGENTFLAAFTQGQHLTPSQALSMQEAEEQTPQPQLPSFFQVPGSAESNKTSQASPARLPLSSGGHLTRREMDVLRGLAQGLSNAQIAERLVISVVTVNSYLRAVYSKLGVSSRTAAVRFAFDHHLL